MVIYARGGSEGTAVEAERRSGEVPLLLHAHLSLCINTVVCVCVPLSIHQCVMK